MLLQFVKTRGFGRKLHGVHSPFVYQLASGFFANPPSCPQAFKYRTALLHSDESLDLSQDLGAGTRFGHKNVGTFKVRSLALKSGCTVRKGKLLAALVQYVQPYQILELGTNLGLGAAFLASEMPTLAALTTVEGDPVLANFAQKQLNSHFLTKRIEVVTSSFQDFLPSYLQSIVEVNFPVLVYLDGNHQYEPTLQMGSQLLEHLPPSSCLVLDDIHLSEPMFNAWKKLTQHPSSTVTLEMFQMGAIFPNRPQENQHFRLAF